MGLLCPGGGWLAAGLGDVPGEAGYLERLSRPPGPGGGGVAGAQHRVMPAEQPGQQWQCVNDCGQPVRRVQAGDGVDPRDYSYVHADGNPVCGFTPAAWPKGVPE